MVTDPHRVLRLWGKHFSTLLQGDDDTNTVFKDVAPNPIADDGLEPKTNKAAGFDELPAEFIKTTCNKLVGHMHQLINKIWPEKSMPNDWNISVL